MQTMYSGKVNSPSTTLDGGIDDSVTTINIVDGAVLPLAPNLAVIGIGEDAETILYATKVGNQLSNVTRGFQGIAKSWSTGEVISRLFTEYDYNALKSNIGTIAGRKISDFAECSSEEFRLKITDETGSGILVYNHSPIFITPDIGKPSAGDLENCSFPTLNQDTTGTAANLSGTPELPNGVKATTQPGNDNSKKLATTAYADAVVPISPLTVSGAEAFNGTSPIIWTDLDLSSIVGQNPAMVILSMRTNQWYKSVSVRKNGDTQEYYSNQCPNNSGYGAALATSMGNLPPVFICVTDNEGKIEWITESAGTWVIKVIAYIK